MHYMVAVAEVTSGRVRRTGAGDGGQKPKKETVSRRKEAWGRQACRGVIWNEGGTKQAVERVSWVGETLVCTGVRGKKRGMRK